MSTLGMRSKNKGTSPWSPAPGIGAFQSMIPGQSQVSGSLHQAILNALQGQFPEEYFQSSIAGPAREQFEQEGAPAIREEFAGPGTFWGTARADKVTRGRSGLEDAIAAERSKMAYQTQQQALQSALSYLGIPLMATYEKPEPYPEPIVLGQYAGSTGFGY